MTVIPPFNIKTNHYNRTSHDVWQTMTKELSNTGPLTLLYGWLDYIVLLTQVPYTLQFLSTTYPRTGTVPMSMLCKQHKGFLINVHVNLHVCQNYKELQSYLLNLVSIYSTASLSLNQSSLNVMESEEAERGGGWFGRIVWGCSGSWLVIVDMSSKHLWSYHKDGSHPGEWLIQPAISTIPSSWMPRPFLALGGWCSHLIQKWQTLCSSLHTYHCLKTFMSISCTHLRIEKSVENEKHLAT